MCIAPISEFGSRGPLRNAVPSFRSPLRHAILPYVRLHTAFGLEIADHATGCLRGKPSADEIIIDILGVLIFTTHN